MPDYGEGATGEKFQAVKEAGAVAYELTRPRFDNIIEEDLAKRGLGIYEESLNWIKTPMSKFKKINDYYRGKHIKYKKGMFSSTINEVRRIAQEAHSHIMQNEIRLRMIAETPVDAAKVAAMDHHMDWYWEQMDIDSVVSRHVRTKLNFGSAWLHVRYDHEYDMASFTGWPMMDSVLPHNVILNPGATNERDCRWLYHVHWMTAREIDIRFPWASNSQPDQDGVEPPNKDLTHLQGGKNEPQRVQYEDGTVARIKGRIRSTYQGDTDLYPVLEFWAKDHWMWDNEPGFEDGGVCIIVGDTVGEIKPNMWGGRVPFVLDVEDPLDGMYVGQGIIEPLIDSNDFLNRCRYLQHRLIIVGSTIWVLDPRGSNINWKQMRRDGNRVMRRVSHNPNMEPKIQIAQGAMQAGSVNRMNTQIVADMERQAGSNRMDLSNARPQDIPSGIAMQTINEINLIRLRPIAKNTFKAVQKAGQLVTYSMVNHVPDTPRRFSVVLSPDEQKTVAPFIEKMQGNRGIISSFTPSLFRSERWDIRYRVTGTSIIDKQASVQTQEALLNTVRLLTPPFHNLIPLVADAYDVPNKDKIKDELRKVAALMDEQFQAQLGGEEQAPGVDPLEVLASIGGILEAEGIPENTIKRILLAGKDMVQEVAAAPPAEGGAPPQTPAAMPAAATGMASAAAV